MRENIENKVRYCILRSPNGQETALICLPEETFEEIWSIMFRNQNGNAPEPPQEPTPEKWHILEMEPSDIRVIKISQDMTSKLFGPIQQAVRVSMSKLVFHTHNQRGK